MSDEAVTVEKLSRVSIGELRQTELIEATIRTIAERGFEKTTIRDIAQVADASPGSIHYYFSNKTELLRAAMVHCDRRFRDEIRDRIRDIDGAVNKLHTIFDLCFPEDESRRTVLNVVIDFWQQASRRDEFRRLFDRAHSAWLQELAGIIEMGVSRGELELNGSSGHEAIALASMIDGLSLYTCVTTQMKPETARSILRERVAEMVKKE